MTGMAVGAHTCFYVMDESFGWMYEFGLTVFNTPEAPLVISISYGWYSFLRLTHKKFSGTNSSNVRMIVMTWLSMAWEIALLCISQIHMIM